MDDYAQKMDAAIPLRCFSDLIETTSYAVGWGLLAVMLISPLFIPGNLIGWPVSRRAIVLARIWWVAPARCRSNPATVWIQTRIKK